MLLTPTLRPAPKSSVHFRYDKATRTFTTEASNLGPGTLFDRVWRDAADMGLTIISERTGNEMVFVIDRTVVDREGDTLQWVLRPAAADELLTLIIFND